MSPEDIEQLKLRARFFRLGEREYAEFDAALDERAVAEIERLGAERDALRELLREARQWISEDDLMAADEPDTWGSLLARIDAALKGGEDV
jgi:uncharacterized protein (DUF1778 family)